MDFRSQLTLLEKKDILHKLDKNISLKYELASHIFHSKEHPVLFSSIKESNYPVVAGLCSQREYLAMGLEIEKQHIIKHLAHAFENPSKPEIVTSAPCQEVVFDAVDLNKLPIPLFFPKDGGPYITAAIMILNDPETGLNSSYHRLMPIDKNCFTLRMVENRQAHTTYHKSGRNMEIAICLGNSAAVMIASSLSPDPGVFELDIANTLEKTPLVKCLTKDLLVPADCEWVLEGRIIDKTVAEGPFVDLTATYDLIREQPVLEIDCITHRQSPLFQVLLPGQQEHKLLMGMPKEPSIYSAVNKEVTCLDVSLTPGGACWLHGVVQIDKKSEEDGKKAIEAAFGAHKSLKNVIVVDTDIDIYNPEIVEWALATRFQADKDLVLKTNQPSSSLDPSATHTPGQKSRTAKLGFDATMPLEGNRDKFLAVPYECTPPDECSMPEA